MINRQYGDAIASEAIKLTRLCFLKETDFGKKGKWAPNKHSPNNKCKRFAYYPALADLLGWTSRRELLDAASGIGGANDGYSHKLHLVVNCIWPGDDHDAAVNDIPADLL